MKILSICYRRNSMQDFKKYKIKEWHNKYSIRNASRRTGTVASSKAELKFYSKYLSQVKKRVAQPKLLILGVTPEIRDLGLKMGFQVVAVDMNWEIIQLMEKFLTIKNRNKETRANRRTH